MKTDVNSCCGGESNPKPQTRARAARGFLAWVLPSAALVLLPKCPACLAAYVMLGTGIGLSISTAIYLRWALLFVSVASLLYLIVNRMNRRGAISNYFRKDAEPCNTQQ